MGPSCNGCYTKNVEVVALRRASGVVVAGFICNNVICCFDIPKHIRSDNGTPFANTNIRLLKEYFISQIKSSLYYFKGRPSKGRQQNSSSKMVYEELQRWVIFSLL